MGDFSPAYPVCTTTATSGTGKKWRQVDSLAQANRMDLVPALRPRNPVLHLESRDAGLGAAPGPPV
ncbi:hypothetical protein OKW41_002610 [Paraburkholderia sp. UCT70]